jgi:hypothetical protein
MDVGSPGSYEIVLALREMCLTMVVNGYDEGTR